MLRTRVSAALFMGGLVVVSGCGRKSADLRAKLIAGSAQPSGPAAEGCVRRDTWAYSRPGWSA